MKSLYSYWDIPEPARLEKVNPDELSNRDVIRYGFIVSGLLTILFLLSCIVELMI